jgi:hypothetical protein
MKIVEIIQEDFGQIASATADIIKSRFSPAGFAPDSLGWSLGGASPNDDKKDASGSDAPSDSGNTTTTDKSTGSKIVVVGDSLAVGTGGQIPNAIVDAKVGINSSAILSKAQTDKQLQGADVAIISAGANDGAGASGKNPNSQKTIANLEGIRSALKAKKYVWILPYNRSVAQDIMSAVKPGDEVVDLSKTTAPSKDGLHPSSYAPVAKDAISKGGVKPQAPVSTPSKSSSGGGKGSVSTNDVKSYLTSKGLSKNHVAGIMANIKAESGFRPGIMGDGGTSGGLFQHHAERFKAMTAACGRDWANNWKGQIDFALSETAGRQYVAMKFDSPEAASKWWTINFERPANMVAKANTRSHDASQFA